MGVTRFLGFLVALGASAFTANAKTEEVRDIEYILQRAQKLSQKGDGKLSRGHISLALHLDPWIGDDPKFSWIKPVVQGEQRSYWRGNVMVGMDKTYLESLFGRQDIFGDSRKSLMALFSWRNLQLVGLSCCGMDNLAVFFQQANKHLYVAPFVDLVPGYGDRLKPDNIKMYKSFRQWWESTGKRPMPEPKIIYKGRGVFEWDALKVVLRAAKIPKGWGDVIQAYLLMRIQRPEDARTAARSAIQKNAELGTVINDLMPAMAKMPLPVAEGSAAIPAAPEMQFVINYNPHVGLGNLAVVMCSSYMLAKLLGRTYVLNWNVNTVVQEGFRLQERPGVVTLLESAVGKELAITPKKVKNLYFFHMMDSFDLGDTLEIFGCSNMKKEFQPYPVVTVSSNMFYAPLLAINPHSGPEVRADFPELLKELLHPSDASAKRSLDFAKAQRWGKDRPVVAIHIRAREEGEDNDDWPTASSPDADILEDLLQCAEAAVQQHLGQDADWDVFIASTTPQAQNAAATALERARGMKSVLRLPSLLRDRRSEQGTVDAMAEALLISRADVFIRLVVGTSGFSTFAFLSNALRRQNDWLEAGGGGASYLERDGFAPNYLITSSCGDARCYVAPADVRMARISWHGDRFTHRSCGKVLEKVEASGTEELGCRGLTAVKLPPREKKRSGEL